MKFRLYFPALLAIVLSSISCERKSDSYNQFITDYLKYNSTQIYKSEIQRIRVNYISYRKTLVYSFWKKAKFVQNGNLFLHLYLKDTTLLPENRKKYGFINLSIKKEDYIQIDSINFYLIKDLSSYGDLNFIKTGQYIGTKRTWYAQHRIENKTHKNILKNRHVKNLPLVDLKYMPNERNNSGFINYLLGLGTKLIYSSEEGVNFYLSQDRSRVYLSLNKKTDSVFNYSIRFFNESEEYSSLLSKKGIGEVKVELNANDDKVKAHEILVPEQTRQIALLSEGLEGNTIIFIKSIDL